MDEFLSDEFLSKLLRLGVVKPEARMALREVLQILDEERKKRNEASSEEDK